MRFFFFLALFISGSLGSCAHGTKSSESDLDDEIRQALALQVPDYKERRASLKRELKILKRETLEAERRGEEVSCASQILNESSWLLGYTAEFVRLEKRLSELRNELAKPPSQRQSDQQSEKDGTWGRCFTEWFFKLSMSGDHILEFAERGQAAKHAPRFLDPINSPEKLKVYLDSILMTDVFRKGRIQRKELNESVSTLVRLIVKNPPKNYRFHPKLRETLLDYIHQHWQNPESGYWGAWIRRRNGTLTKTDDLSITFHLLSYLKGNVSRLDKIFKTTLAIRNSQYPLGWLEEGQYENHHSYDVVRILRSSWPYASLEDRAIAEQEIRKMLVECLSKSLQPDGSFALGNSDDSLGDSYYFGVSFLAEVGFFDPGKRFWTDEELPPSSEIREKLIQRINELSQTSNQGGPSGIHLRNALDKLGDPARRTGNLEKGVNPEVDSK